MAAAPAAMFAYGMVHAPMETLQSIPVLLIAIVSLPGLIGFILAVLPTLVLGCVLGLAARIRPFLRRKLVWLATGLLFGVPLGLAIDATWTGALVGAAAGAACAITFRLILGRALEPAPATT